jgi:hypothetical protein
MGKCVYCRNTLATSKEHSNGYHSVCSIASGNGKIFKEQVIVPNLKDSDKCLETFEEYANGGMAIINDKLLDHPEDQSGIDTLSAMVAKVHAGFAAKTTKNTKDKIKF